MLSFGHDFGPLIGIWQGICAFGDSGPDFAEFSIDSDEVSLIFRHIFFGIDSVDRALWNTHSTVDALVRIDHKEVGSGFETVNWTNINAIRISASDARFSHNIGHFNPWE
jgi:hypothetical protein